LYSISRRSSLAILSFIFLRSSLSAPAPSKDEKV
jgi:hypothetical protein